MDISDPTVKHLNVVQKYTITILAPLRPFTYVLALVTTITFVQQTKQGTTYLHILVTFPYKFMSNQHTSHVSVFPYIFMFHNLCCKNNIHNSL